MRLSLSQCFSRLRNDCFADDVPRYVVIFTLLFFYFLFSQIMTSSTFVYNVGFYGLLFPAFLYTCYRQPQLIARIPRTIATVAMALFLAYVLVQSTLLDPQYAGKTLWEVVQNGVFLIMVFIIFGDRRIASLQLLRPFIGVVIAFALLSLAIHYYVKPPSYMYKITKYMFVPIGRAHNPIPIDSLYCMGVLLGMWLFFQPAASRRWKLTAIACAVVIVALIFITLERGPLLALAVAGGVGLLALQQWRLLIALTLAGSILGADFLYYLSHQTSMLHLQSLYEMLHLYFFGKDSYRERIWIKAFSLIREHPWGGHGLQSLFEHGTDLPGAVNPHNLFISALYYHGIPGFVLFMVPLIAAFYYALRNIKNPYHQLCLIWLVHGVVATFTNYGQAVKAPNALWMLYWMPIAMVLARPYGEPKSDMPAPALETQAA